MKVGRKKAQVSLSGMSKVGALVFISIFAAFVYLGSKIFPFFYNYYEVKGLMDAQARKADVFNDDQIRENILKLVRELDIPIRREEDLKIFRLGRKIVITLDYTEVLYLTYDENDYVLWEFEFSPKVEKQS